MGVFSQGFLFSHVEVLCGEVSLVCYLKYPCIFCLPILLLVSVILFVLAFVFDLTYLSLLFLCILRVLVSMNQRYLQCWRVLFRIFLTYIVCLYHRLDVKPQVSWVFLFFGLLVEVILVLFKNSPEYLTRRNHKGVCAFDESPTIECGFDEIFCSPEIHFYIFFFYRLLFDGFRYQYS